MRLPALLVCAPLLLPLSDAAPHAANTDALLAPRREAQAESVRELQKRATQRHRAQAVKNAFQFAWDGYYKYAFPNDELLPVTNGASNSRNGWGASAVDALSTAIVMEIPSIVNTIVDYIPTINYAVSRNNEVVSLFETTIRYLGGMLSAYDFLTGPLAHLATNKTNVAALLTQSEKLANLLSFAFDTPTGIPNNYVFFNNHSMAAGQTNGLATIGTLVLEWTHLADLTGNQTYASLAQRGESYLLNPQPPQDQPWPGLLGTNVNFTTGKFLGSNGGWVGGDDSFYEYLIKMYVYDQSRFANYRDRWVLAVDSSIAHIASHPSSQPNLTYLAEFQGQKLVNQSEHLACFAGGNFILGGQVLGRQDIVNFGLELVASCHNTYTSTVTGIGPEAFSWENQNVPANQLAFYNKHGFFITDGLYDLRPEVLESIYYAYRVTGNTMYQDWAWTAFQAINRTCRAGSGFSSVNDVNQAGGGGKLNFQESFLFAEVMKYAYLIFSADVPWDVEYQGKNQWVFNTEAHPLRVAGTPI